MVVVGVEVGTRDVQELVLGPSGLPVFGWGSLLMSGWSGQDAINVAILHERLKIQSNMRPKGVEPAKKMPLAA